MLPDGLEFRLQAAAVERSDDRPLHRVNAELRTALPREGADARHGRQSSHGAPPGQGERGAPAAAVEE